MVPDWPAGEVFAFMLVFARLGGALMVMPVFGEIAVPARIRLGLALAITLILLPVVQAGLPPLPAAPVAVALVTGAETLTGIAIGMVVRLLTAGLQTGGTIIAFNMGLGSAQLFDPQARQQGAIVGAFYGTIGVLLLLVTDLHHLMLMALAGSYDLFPPGAGLPAGDFARLASRLASGAFQTGLMIALPVIVVSTIVFVAMGLMARLMPQMQVFFVALPLQIGLGFLVMALGLGAGAMLFAETFRAGLSGFLAG